jgi:hypothetical protein
VAIGQVLNFVAVRKSRLERFAVMDPHRLGKCLHEFENLFVGRNVGREDDRGRFRIRWARCRRRRGGAVQPGFEVRLRGNCRQKNGEEREFFHWLRR